MRRSSAALLSSASARVLVRWPTCSASCAFGVGDNSELAKRPYVCNHHGADRNATQMKTRPSGTHNQAVSWPVTGMKAYQLGQPPDRSVPWMPGMATPKSPDKASTRGSSVNTQPTQGSSNNHNKSRQVAGSDNRLPLSRSERRHLPFCASPGSRPDSSLPSR